MPSSATITAFYSFTANATIKSADVNSNFSLIRGHLIPIDASAASSPNLTYDLGSIDHAWRGNFHQYGMMYGNTAASIPTVATTTHYALYFKNDFNLYKKNSVGTESAFLTGNPNVASTIGGFTLTNSNDVVLCNISSASTYNLFTSVGNTGKIITFKNVGAAVATIDASTTETIDGDLTYSLSNVNEVVRIISDGANWKIINNKKLPTITRYTSGSGSYTPQVGIKMLRITILGGGGGGGGSSTVAANNGGVGSVGGDSTFGSLLTAGGGGAGSGASTSLGGGGGTATITAPATAVKSAQGGKGGGNAQTVAGGYLMGSPGGVSAIGGGGGGGVIITNATASYANTGGGGEGAGTPVAGQSGSGGGAGAYIEALIYNPISLTTGAFAYAVGASGAGGAAGTSGFIGGAGASGVIVVEEYY